MPKLQTWPPVQTLPQLPQLFGSCWVRTQTPLHLVKPPPAHWQLELTQMPLGPQLIPHPPQLAESAAGLMHTAPQRMNPTGHALWQTPAAQV